MREAHHIRPTVMIGKMGLTEPVVASTDESLSCRELIKVKWVGFKESKLEMFSELARRTGAEEVAVIGNVGILYRRNADPQLNVIPGVPRE